MDRWSITAHSLSDRGVARCLRAVTDTRPIATPLHPLPAQGDELAWPTVEWPVGKLPEAVDLEDLIAEAFDPEGPMHQTFAVVIVHRGRLVFERYGGLL